MVEAPSLDVHPKSPQTIKVKKNKLDQNLSSTFTCMNPGQASSQRHKTLPKRLSKDIKPNQNLYKITEIYIGKQKRNDR